MQWSQAIGNQVEASQVVGLYELNAVADVCERHSIPFYLDSGTLLGAYRQASWLAWDDDIDILMFRSDYKRFRSVAAIELPKDLALRDPEQDDSCISVVPRVNYLHSGFYWEERLGLVPPERQCIALDIYLIDPVPPGTLARAAWQTGIDVLQALHAVRGTTYRRIWRSASGNPDKTAATVALGVSRALPKSWWKWLFPRWASLPTRFHSDRVAVTHSTALRRLVFPRRWFTAESTYLTFESRQFRVPNPEPYLAALYGDDFQVPPPLDERMPHPVAEFWARFEDRVWDNRALRG